MGTLSEGKAGRDDGTRNGRQEPRWEFGQKGAGVIPGAEAGA